MILTFRTSGAWAHPTIDKATDNDSARSSNARAARDAKFRARAGELARERPALYLHLLEVLVQLAYIGPCGVVTPILEGLDAHRPADTPAVGSTLTPRSGTKSHQS